LVRFALSHPAVAFVRREFDLPAATRGQFLPSDLQEGARTPSAVSQISTITGSKRWRKDGFIPL
jgi:hypothetical protein